MEIQKMRSGAAPWSVGAEELAQINNLSKRELCAEEVYTFAVRLCDNEVDRDGERFGEAALHALGRLFVGKSGIFDHNWSAEGQTARIYRTEICREDGVLTAAGDGYCYLKGYAYMLRSEKNADLIAEIDAGIKKEVSVGCAVARSVCSVCGAAAGTCEHVKGRRYGGKLCYTELCEPTDAYEWSFVAVPAQRQAGVMKRFGGAQSLKTFIEQSRDDAMLREFCALEEEAEMGRRYLAALRKEVSRLALLCDEGAQEEIFGGIAQKLDEGELLEMKRLYEKRLGALFPASVQIGAREGDIDRTAEEAFLV